MNKLEKLTLQNTKEKINSNIIKNKKKFLEQKYT